MIVRVFETDNEVETGGGVVPGDYRSAGSLPSPPRGGGGEPSNMRNVQIPTELCADFRVKVGGCARGASCRFLHYGFDEV